MPVTLIAALAGIVAGLVQASFFEWIYHRNWLHRPWLPPMMFTAHTLVHHQLCKHDDTFHVTEEEQEEALSFQWWGGMALTGINALPWLGAAFLLSRFGVALPYGAFIGALVGTFFCYTVAYEGLHLLMHKPMAPWLENAGFFQFIKNHHRLHHVHMGTNFNVVLPLADLCLGTMIRTDADERRLTGPEAKRVARRHSRFGKKLREMGDAEHGLPPRPSGSSGAPSTATGAATAEAPALETIGAGSDQD